MTIRDCSACHSCDVCVPRLALRDDPCHESNCSAGSCTHASTLRNYRADFCTIGSYGRKAVAITVRGGAMILHMIKGPETLDEALGRVIADIRASMGMTQAVFAEKVAHVSKRSLVEYERGRVSLRINVLQDISTETDVEIGEMLRRAQENLELSQQLRKRVERQQGR